jgi:hypothetical protein
MRPRLEERPLGDQNSDSCHARPRSGNPIASRNLPAVTSSTITDRRAASPSTVSSQASHPQLGNASVRQRPSRTWSPGNAVNTRTIGAASGLRGRSFMLGRTRSLLSSSWSRPYPSRRSTSKVASSRLSKRTAKSCRARKRSGSVRREYASGGGPSLSQRLPLISPVQFHLGPSNKIIYGSCLLVKPAQRAPPPGTPGHSCSTCNALVAKRQQAIYNIAYSSI